MIIAAADGSSLSNPGPAGWAWYVDDEHWAAGGWPHGTNNMGELMAVLDLLQQTRGVAGQGLHVLCDSQYAIKCCTEWLKGWKRRGWRKADGKPVLNVELVQALDRELEGRSVTFEWVKGHAGHTLNEAADLRARAAATAFRDGTAVSSGPGWAGEHSPARDLAVAPSQRPVPEPDLFSSDDQDADQAAMLLDLERELLTDDCRSNPARLADLLHPQFVEHGASGGILTRHRAVVALEPVSRPVQVDLLGIDEYGPDLVGLRYRLVQGSRATLRYSLWQRGPRGWQLRFHQGTPAR